MIFAFAFVSIIVSIIYSYGLRDNNPTKDTFSDVDKQVVLPKEEGGGAVDESPIDKNIILQKEKDLDLILKTIEDRKTDDLILVNKWNLLSESYKPSPILDGAGDIPSTKKEMLLQENALRAAIKLFDGINSEGITGLRAVSGYRPFSYQSQLYNAKVNYFANDFDLETAKEKASEIVAVPGTSEHQTGLVIDFSCLELLKTSDPLVEEFKNSPEGKWLYENAWKYGFTLRYLPEKKDITGIISEPWHFRYVGIPHAEYMNNNNLSLEEYIEYLKKIEQITFEDYHGNKYQINYVQKEEYGILLGDEFDIEKVIAVSGSTKDEYIITQKLELE